MSDDQQLEGLLHQIHDLHIRPLAQVVTQTLALLVRNGGITKDEARFAIASATGVITPTDWSSEAKEDAAKVLRDMLNAIDSL